MNIFNYSFLLLFSCALSASIPEPKDIEQAVKDFDTRLRAELSPSLKVNVEDEVDKFRRSQIKKHMPLWRSSIDSLQPATQVLYEFKIPIFFSQIPEIVKQYQKDQNIENISNYYEDLLKYYTHKLKGLAIDDLKSEQDVKDYALAARIKQTVYSQIAKPSLEGVAILAREIQKTFVTFDLSQIQRNLENALNQRFQK